MIRSWYNPFIQTPNKRKAEQPSQVTHWWQEIDRKIDSWWWSPKRSILMAGGHFEIYSCFFPHLIYVFLSHFFGGWQPLTLLLKWNQRFHINGCSNTLYLCQVEPRFFKATPWTLKNQQKKMPYPCNLYNMLPAFSWYFIGKCRWICHTWILWVIYIYIIYI